MNQPEPLQNPTPDTRIPDTPTPETPTPETPTPDTRLNQLLTHLNSTQPPAGLHDRLLQNLATQAVPQPAPARFSPARKQPRNPLWALGLTGAAAAALAVFALLPSHRTHPQPPPQSIPVNRATDATNPANAGSTDPVTPADTPQTSQRKTSSLAAPNHPVLIPATQPNLHTLSSEKLINENAQALDDLTAPSQPAPPLPLTAQEQAILHLLRRNGAVEMAQLDPALQAKRFERQRADLQQFFDPPPTPNPSALSPEGETK